MSSEIKEKVEATRKAQTWRSLGANLFAILAAALGSLLSLADIANREPQLFYIVGAFMVLLIATTRVAIYIKKGSAKASTLRESLARAYLDAIEDSVLKPKREGGLSNG